MIDTPPDSTTVGRFIDSKTVGHTQRTPQAVAGRLIEETVELALVVGVKSGKIFDHVADSLANQAIKASMSNRHTMFPSQLNDDYVAPTEGTDAVVLHDINIAGEVADVRLVLKDLLHVLQFNVEVMDEAEARKWASFIEKEFRVAENGCLYAKKLHVK
jgi:NTP pyrophosphatase (non-canonical NTP hydrolase)